MSYKLVSNEPYYWEFIRCLRNTDGIRQGFVQQDEITTDHHQQYMKKNGNFFWICLDNEVPIGYIGIIDFDIRVATLPRYHGKGVASFMVNEIMKSNPQAVAKVKIDNHASLRLFEKCGFKKKYYILEKE